MNYVSFLIDQGWKYQDIAQIKKGVLRGEEILKNDSSKYRQKSLCKLCYFIGNGYSNLYAINYYKLGFQKIIANPYLTSAKKYYREAIAKSSHVNNIIKKQLWTNYGNCLDILGRSIEALYAYEEALKVDPEFSMALGNKAIAMKLFANISGTYWDAIHVYAYRILKSLLKNEDLIRTGGFEAKYNFEREIRIIESLIDPEILKTDIVHPPIDYSEKTSFEKFYIQFCLENSLFLNFHIHEDQCEASIGDPIFIRLSSSGDNSSFYELAKHINQIKEDYAVARLLLVQSQFKRLDLTKINEITTYAITPDYSTFNLYMGILKSAFKDAYNVLDKIAIFINDYFWLGISNPKNISFTKKELWRDKIAKNNWKIKLEIKESENPSLYALYDIYLDLESESNYYWKLRDMRNKLVHDKLIIHSLDWDGNEDKYNIKVDNMLKNTIELLKLVRSAIVYLINAVEIKENMKMRLSLTGNLIETY